MIIKIKQSKLLIASLSASLLLSATILVNIVHADTYTIQPGEQCKTGETLNTVQRPSGIPALTCTTNPQQTTPTGPSGTPTQAPEEVKSTSEGPADGTTCAVEKVGWIVCPVIESAAKVGDFLFRFLANNFLQVDQSLYKSDPNNGTMVSWGIARNFANILFIIAFLFIIYSQITGAALGNYGIKRMLPRLIVAAILVNVSFYICQFMVDVSNILGYNIKKLLVDTAQTISTTSAMPVVDGGFANVTNSDGVLGMIATAALLGATVWILLGPLVGIIGLIVITCIIIVIILLLRKTLIILLIVASPIAFVAYLLPNTEKFFKKWLDMFWKLLMVFPVVALLLGGGQLASAIILSAGTSSNVDSSDSYKIAAEERCVNLADGKTGTVPDEECDPAGKGGPGIMLALVAAGVAVAPMLAVISVLKAALAGAGALGGKIAGAVESRSKQGAGALSKSSVGRGIAARKAIKQNYKDQKFAGKMAGSGRKGRFTRIAARGVGGNAGLVASKLTSAMPNTGKIGSLKGGINTVTGGLQAQNSKLNANFAGASAKIAKQDVEDSKSLLEQKHLGTGFDAATGTFTADATSLTKSFEDAVKRGDQAGAKAAQELLMAAGEDGAHAFAASISRLQTQGIRGGSGPGSNETLNDVQRHITTYQSDMKGSNADIYSWASNPAGGADFNAAVNNSYGGLTDGQIATQSKRSLRRARDTGSVDQVRANRILGNDSINGSIKGTQQSILGNLGDRTR